MLASLAAISAEFSDTDEAAVLEMLENLQEKTPHIQQEQ